jgi:hypothetical protein
MLISTQDRVDLDDTETNLNLNPKLALEDPE